MTPTQITAVLATSGDTTAAPNHVKSVSLSSGKSYSLQQNASSPGRYTATFDDANELIAFTQWTAQAAGPETSVATEYTSYDSVESIGMFSA
jgi:hypothetical protein